MKAAGGSPSRSAIAQTTEERTHPHPRDVWHAAGGRSRSDRPHRYRPFADTRPQPFAQSADSWMRPGCRFKRDVQAFEGPAHRRSRGPREGCSSAFAVPSMPSDLTRRKGRWHRRQAGLGGTSWFMGETSLVERSGPRVAPIGMLQRRNARGGGLTGEDASRRHRA